MNDITERTLAGFLDQLADRTPTPGGGAATGLAGASACALARMVAAYSVGGNTPADSRSRIESTARRLHHADQLLRALITQDAAAYAEMTEARKAARQADADNRAQELYQAAVLSAAAVPLEMAAVCSDALTTLDEVKTHLSRFLVSDLAIAAALAEATVRSARYTVLVNLPELTDRQTAGRLRDDVNAITEHAAGRRAAIHAFASDALEPSATRDR